MPKVTDLYFKLQTLVKQYADDRIVLDGDGLKCEACLTPIRVDKSHQQQPIRQHVQSHKHRKNVMESKPAIRCMWNSSSSSSSKSIDDLLKTAEHAGDGLQKSKKTAKHRAGSEKRSARRSDPEKDDLAAKEAEFELDLTMAFVESGIPLFKLNSKPLKSFLEKYTQRKIPDESTLRKNYTSKIYEGTVAKIRAEVSDSDVCFLLDETTDAKKRMVLNVLVCPLNGQPKRPMLIKMYFLEKATSSTIAQSVINTCAFLWPKGIKYEKLQLLIAGQSSTYMQQAAENLKAMFPRLKYVACLARCLHSVCECIRDQFPLAFRFTSELRKIMLKTQPILLQINSDETVEVPTPPDASISRWGQWIQCVTFYYQNFSKLLTFVNTLSTESNNSGGGTPSTDAIENVKKLMFDYQLQSELFNVSTYEFLPRAIERLEGERLTKVDQWKLIVEVSEQLSGYAKEKLISILKQTPDLELFVTMETAATPSPPGNPPPSGDDDNNSTPTLYASLICIEVERTFSQYRRILSGRQQNLTTQHVEILNVIAYNKFLSESEEDEEIMTSST